MKSATFLLFAYFGLFYQYHRLITTVKSLSKFLLDSSPEASKKNAHALISLRKRQFGPTFIFTAIAIFILVLLSARVIPWTWEWFLLPSSGAETIAAVVQEFFFSKRPKSSKNNTDSATGSKTTAKLSPTASKLNNNGSTIFNSELGMLSPASGSSFHELPSINFENN
jgi:hypothetical protein